MEAGVNTIIYLAMMGAIFAGLWRIYEKAGEEGWKALVPFYNTWVWVHMVGRPSWFFLLVFIPFVNIYAYCAMLNDLSKGFGKGIAFTFGTILMPFIFLPLLGFGDAQWTKPRKPDPSAPGSPA